MEKISGQVSDQFKKDPDGLISNATCRRGCSEASSSLRLFTASAVSPKIDLSRETRECEKICEVYFSNYYGYVKGIQAGLSNKIPASTDCSGAVSSGTRKFKPSLNSVNLEKAIKSSAGTGK